MRIGRVERVWAAEELRPAVGWKVWRVSHEPEGARLRSVLYGDLWPVGEPFEARCRRSAHDEHEPPRPGCGCGIHAGRELAAWEHYLAVDPANRVFGRVLLWGATIEGRHGWRAARACPAEIFVPAGVELADGLEQYGVPLRRLGRVRELALR